MPQMHKRPRQLMLLPILAWRGQMPQLWAHPRALFMIGVPFTALPKGQQGIDTKLPNGQNYGFVVNTQRILANRKFIEDNPAAKKLFEEMKLPVADINAQNQAMHDGANKPADIERQTDGWIKAHQKTFDQWIADATAAAQ